MEGLTFTVGQRNGKLVIDYGFKGYRYINIESIPNILNIRGLLKGFISRESLTDKIRNFIKRYKPFQKREKGESSMTRPYRSVHIPVGGNTKEKKPIIHTY